MKKCSLDRLPYLPHLRMEYYEVLPVQESGVYSHPKKSRLFYDVSRCSHSWNTIMGEK